MLTLIFSTVVFSFIACILFAFLFVMLTFFFGKEMNQDQNSYIISYSLFELCEAQQN